MKYKCQETSERRRKKLSEIKPNQFTCMDLVEEIDHGHRLKLRKTESKGTKHLSIEANRHLGK